LLGLTELAGQLRQPARAEHEGEHDEHDDELGALEECQHAPTIRRLHGCYTGAMTTPDSPQPSPPLSPPPVGDVVTSVEQLRSLYRRPSSLVQRKKQTSIDEVCQAVLAACPFVLLATSGSDGSCDVSPRGGPPGFVKVLDDRHVAIPDLNGNNLIDSISNIVTNAHAGLLCVMPGRDETLRVDGPAWVTTSAAVLDRWTDELRRPTTAIVIETAAVFLHCAKSFRRGRVWEPASWDEMVAPDGIDIIRCHLSLDATAAELREQFEHGYAADLAADRPA